MADGFISVLHFLIAGGDLLCSTIYKRNMSSFSNRRAIGFLKRFLLLAAFWTLTLIGFAQQSKWFIEPKVGYTTQNFGWSVAGNESGTNPNILSELIWSELGGMQYSLNVGYTPINKLQIYVTSSYNNIQRGYGNDSDYADDNRTARYYDLDFRSDGGYSYDIRIAGSYDLVEFGSFMLRVMTGYHQIGHQLFLLPLPGDESLVDLETTYRPTWYGGSGGLGLTYHLNRFAVLGTYRLGLYDYQAEATWNLRDDLQQPVSFHQYAFGITHTGDIQLRYQLSSRIGLVLSGEYSTGFTRPGLDVTYQSNGSEGRTMLNTAEYDRFSTSIGIRHLF